MNPYHVLEVPAHADLAEIRASYRRLVRVHHPDCAPDEAARAAASERMVEINWAWHIVSDAQRRAIFDARMQVEQIELARHQQEALRAQIRGQVVRGQQAHLADVLRAQMQRKQGKNKGTKTQATPPLTSEQRAREVKRMEQQALERDRRERAHQIWTRPTRKRLTAQEKKASRQERAQLRREDKKQSSNPSARRQLAEATRLFRQEGRAGEAIAICHDVLRVDFRNVPARELLGDFYLQLGREDRTLPLWEQVLSLQPDNAAVRRKLNSLRPRASYSYATQSQSPSNHAETDGKTMTATANNGFWGRVLNAFRSGL